MEGGLSRSVSCEESLEWQCPQGAVGLHSPGRRKTANRIPQRDAYKVCSRHRET